MFIVGYLVWGDANLKVLKEAPTPGCSWMPGRLGKSKKETWHSFLWVLSGGVVVYKLFLIYSFTKVYSGL